MKWRHLVLVFVFVTAAAAAWAQANGARYQGTWATSGFGGTGPATCVVSIRGTQDYYRTLQCTADGRTGGFNLSSCRFTDAGRQVHCQMGDASHGNLETFQGRLVQ